MGAPEMNRYASGGLINKLVGAVAKEAPELSRGAITGRAVVNIGLDINGGERLHPDEVLAALKNFGVTPVSARIAQSDTEPTLVVELDRALNPREAHDLSAALKQEAIAQVDESGVGDLHGPAADNWKPFNGDYFIKPDGQRLGSGQSAVLRGIEELTGEPVKKAGGGLVEKAAKMLLGAAEHGDEAAPQVLRLYHGTTKLPNTIVEKEGRRFVEYGDGSRGFDVLSPDIKSSQLGLHVGSKPQADYFASDGNHLNDADILLNKDYYSKMAPAGGRIAPLDVTLKNPIRLEDRTGSWKPSEIYDQLTRLGKVENNSEVWAKLRDMEVSGKPGDQSKARDIVRQMIEDAGHDGVVYTNRVEGFTTDDPIRRRFVKRGIYDESSLDDQQWLDVVPEAKGNDSYIVWKPETYKSPFGDGPGVGFADGGEVRQKYANAGLVRKLGQGIVDLMDFSGIAGRPSHVVIPGEGRIAAAPIKEIDDAAEAYMKGAGLSGTHRIDAYPQFDEDFAHRVAQAYDGLRHDPNNPEVQRAYEALIDETMAQYKALKDTGLDVKFLKDGMDDPYAASPSMGYADMVKNGRLWVFPTSQGYGSGAEVLEHPLLKKVGKVGDLEDAVANDAFRAVHDAYGHFGPGNPFFRAPGEDRAWMHHARMYSDDALPAMSAETRGQNSWVNSGPQALANKGASGADTIYADQKAVIMPSWVYEKDLGRTPFADGGQVSPEEAAAMTHWDSYGVGSAPAFLETMGTKIPLGDGPIYYRDGETYAPRNEGPQMLHDVARFGLYAVPGGAPVATALDTTEAALTGSPGEAAAALVLGPTSRPVKAVASAIGAATAVPSDADAGVFGRLAKWATSGEGKDAFNLALKMSGQGADNAEIMSRTGWFRDLDGHWKFWRPSTGGGLNEPLRGSRLADVYNDPFLFDEYPQMKDIGFRRKNEEGGHWDAQNNEIVLGDTSGPGYNTPQAGGRYGAMTHEIYHAKSDAEGWPQGTSVVAATNRMGNDVRSLNNIPPGGPVGGPGDLLAKAIGGNENFSRLGFKRYQAEMGEALARREAEMREMSPELMRASSRAGITPASQEFIDMPINSLFQPGQNPTMDQYRELLKIIEDEQAARAAAEAAAKKTKGRR